MTYGEGNHRYEVVENWFRLPDSLALGVVSAVAVDSKDRVYVYHRGEHPMVVFDREGNFVGTWGDDVLKAAHGLFIDGEDHVYCVEWKTHCVRKFTTDGTLLMTLGAPDQPAEDGKPFRLPTDLGVSPTNEIFVSDGYDNFRIHRFTPRGDWVRSWGEKGDGPDQFALPHSVRVDRYDRVWVCDRENNRIQIFTSEGEYLTEWPGLLRPDSVCFDPKEDLVYVAELTHRVSIFTLAGDLIAQWGGGVESDKPGEFLGWPHGLCVDSHGDLYIAEVKVEGRLQKFVRTS